MSSRDLRSAARLSATFPLGNIADSRQHPAQHFAAEQSGSGLIEMVLVGFVFLMMLAGSVDLGQGCYVAIELAAAANAGAQYGTRNPTDTTGMNDAATLGAPNLNGMTTSAAWGCECPDGSAASASCSSKPGCNNVVRYVSVATSKAYKPPLGFFGIPSSIPLSSTARMRAGY